MTRRRKKKPRKRRSYASMMREAVRLGLLGPDLFPPDGRLAEILKTSLPAR